MTSALPVTIAIVIAVALLSVAARQIGITASILLLGAGAALSFVPGVPAVALDPDVVLLVLLPPLLYSAGVNMSWRGFRSNLRPILLLSVGCVLFTASMVAAVAHYALGLPWAVGFVIGAIVSPPDAVAPMAVMRRLGIPRRLLTVLEGESLVNDATALVAFNFALLAVAQIIHTVHQYRQQTALLVLRIMFAYPVHCLAIQPQSRILLGDGHT